MAVARRGRHGGGPGEAAAPSSLRICVCYVEDYGCVRCSMFPTRTMRTENGTVH
uniref:Uncharacterized protein n=1 Tax=Oryza sativa subsp. japonica TaxID=39947 RepID=Q2R225_ORYSJ|nr:hypothetical protein LOC_Os11g37250 [Oryza sativa Japonica Group]